MVRLRMGRGTGFLSAQREAVSLHERALWRGRTKTGERPFDRLRVTTGERNGGSALNERGYREHKGDRLTMDRGFPGELHR
jgi:hypothetical protein